MTAILPPPCPLSLADLQAQLPVTPLYGAPTPDDAATGWRLSPMPYELTSADYAFLIKLGPQLQQFLHAADTLYRNAAKDPELAWVRTLLDTGKPPHLLQFAQMNRFKHALPTVIRPDLLVTPDGFKLSEIDSVPGGIGFTAALSQAYQALGFSLAGETTDMPQAFLSMLLAQAGQASDTPEIAIVLSDEASDYHAEMAWLVGTIRPDYPHIHLVHPKAITLQGNRLGHTDPEGRFIPIDRVYRFFELFDLPNIPQIELIQYAVKKGLVTCTPPFKPHLEEKALLALLHAPRLASFWHAQLGQETFATLHTLVPETWLLDPAIIPPHAQVVPPLQFGQTHYADFTQLDSLSQKQRELVIKPSGFSPLAWGSRGVKIGHDMPQDAWKAALNDALAAYNQTPHLLQRFHNTTVHPYTYFDPQTADIIQAQGRTRLCPYYFAQAEGLQLAGILATTCPSNKKIIHGMRDGVMRPAVIV